MASKFGFVRMAHNFENLKRELPPMIGNMGQNFFRRSFEQQGFTDKSTVKWQEVQRRIPGTPAYKYPKKNADDRHKRGILIGLRTKGGEHLRDSVNRSLKTATFSDITFSVPQRYAAVHNEGLTMKNGKKMPQRKFMGHSEELISRISAKVVSSMHALRK